MPLYVLWARQHVKRFFIGREQKKMTELKREIQDLLEELGKGAEISVTMGMAGHDISPELQDVIENAVRAYLDLLKGDVENG